MFAVIKTGGKQYRVAADDVIKIEKIAGDVGEIVQLGEVLAHGNGDDVTFGAPFVGGASVAVEVVEQGRAPTVIAFKKRRRQNSRRKRGHRQLLTTVRISEILVDGAKPSKKAAEKPAKKEKAAASGDDLTKIKGVGPKAADQLAEQGITSYADLAALDDAAIAKLDEAMPFSAEQIAEWRDQAKEMAK
jgi:large subunit ribosomal protein L21